VQLQATDAERVLLTLVGAGDESVDDTASWNLNVPIEPSSVCLARRTSLQLGNLSTLDHPSDQRPQPIRNELVNEATWRRIIADQPQKERNDIQRKTHSAEN
jgi:hypothetical protein